MDEDFKPEIPSGDTRDNCSICSGTGVCDMCGGNGTHYDLDPEGIVIQDTARDCGHCNAPGMKPGKCSYCRGTKKNHPEFFDAPGTYGRMEQLNRTLSQNDSISYER